MIHFFKGEEPLVGGWKKYRKTSLAEAVQINEPFEVETLEGTMRGRAGDYLMRGAHGELYPCAKAIFEQTYEEVTK